VISMGRIVFGLVAVSLLSTCACGGEGKPEHRWLFVMRNLRRPENVQDTIQLLPRAAAAGYNAVVLSDSTLYRLERADDSYAQNVLRVQEEARRYGLDLIPCVMPIGYSGSIIGKDPNLAEGVPVKDALFAVRGASASLVPDPPVSLPGGGFEQVQDHRFAGWDMQDYPGKSTFADRQVAHSGRTSVRMEGIPEADPEHGHCRFMRSVKVQPFRQYRLSAWIKTRDFEAPNTVAMAVLAPTEKERTVAHLRPDVEPTQDWTHYRFVFNSLNWSEVRIYFGTWRGKAGRIWWDDVALDEIAFMNLLSTRLLNSPSLVARTFRTP